VARAAAALAPDHPPNQSALGEALLANDRSDEGRAALGRALDLARARAAAGDPDAPDWIREAERLLRAME
jgi:Flp pilus assembly protein TadD